MASDKDGTARGREGVTKLTIIRCRVGKGGWSVMDSSQASELTRATVVDKTRLWSQRQVATTTTNTFT